MNIPLIENDPLVLTEIASSPALAVDLPFSIEGAMTIYEVAELKNSLLEKISSLETLVIDLAKVSDIDTAGLQLLLALRRCARPVVLINPSHCVQQIVSLLQLDDLLSPTIEEPGAIS